MFRSASVKNSDIDTMKYEDKLLTIIKEKMLPLALDLEIESEKMLLQESSQENSKVFESEKEYLSCSLKEVIPQDFALNDFECATTKALDPEIISANINADDIPQTHSDEICKSSKPIISVNKETDAPAINTTANPLQDQTAEQLEFVDTNEVKKELAACPDTSACPNPIDPLMRKDLLNIKLEVKSEYPLVKKENSNSLLQNFLIEHSEFLKPESTKSVIQVKNCYMRTIPKTAHVLKNLSRKPQIGRAQYFNKPFTSGIHDRKVYVKPKPLSIILQRVEEWYEGPCILPPHDLQLLDFKRYKKPDEIKITNVMSLSDLQPKQDDNCLKHACDDDVEMNNSDPNEEVFSSELPSTSLNEEQIQLLSNSSENNGPIKVHYCRRCKITFGNFELLVDHYRQHHADVLSKIIQKNGHIIVKEENLGNLTQTHDSSVVNNAPEQMEINPDIIKTEISCCVCGFVAVTQNHLEYHMKEHGKRNEKKKSIGTYKVSVQAKKEDICYLCELCHYIFLKKDLFIQHLRQFHGAPPSSLKKFVKRYMCTVCSRVYRGSHSLGSHVFKTHSSLMHAAPNLKKIVYVMENECETSLSAPFRVDFNNSEIEHVEREFSCKFCNIKLGTQASAAKHMLTEHCN